MCTRCDTSVSNRTTNTRTQICNYRAAPCSAVKLSLLYSMSTLKPTVFSVLLQLVHFSQTSISTCLVYDAVTKGQLQAFGNETARAIYNQWIPSKNSDNLSVLRALESLLSANVLSESEQILDKDIRLSYRDYSSSALTGRRRSSRYG